MQHGGISSLVAMNLLMCLLRVASATAVATRRGSSSLPWTLLPTNTTQRFRGLSAVSETTAWVAGTNSTVLRTTDAGKTWASVGPPMAPEDATLQFYDVEASDAQRAVILSTSRIYVTDDGGRSWANTFVNQEANAFYNCLALDGWLYGLAVSDPVNGKFSIIKTVNGGMNWTAVDPAGIPPALVGEVVGFAASGTCLAYGMGGHVYFVSGGVNPGRVYRSADEGNTWVVTGTPVAGGAAAGISSVQFRDEENGIIVGGDSLVPNGMNANAAWSSDGGVTWVAARNLPGGFRSGCAWVPGVEVAIAVGPTGSDITSDGGKTWRIFDDTSFDAVQCPSSRACWASGQDGRVARLEL